MQELIAVILLLTNGTVRSCDRVVGETGQIVCETNCTKREDLCPGADPIVCERIEIIHPSFVEQITVAGQPHR